MRISSNTLFNYNVAALNQQQALLAQTQQQAASGTRLTNAATDPVAYTRALDLAKADAINVQQTLNRNTAEDQLTFAGGAMQSATSLLQDIRTTAITAGNSNLTDADRLTLANSLSGQLQQLIGLANSTDGSGSYLFSGFQSKAAPFVDSPAGVIYNGDTGQQSIQVSPGRQMAVNDNGADVFMRIKNGNGVFATQASAANTGTGTIDAGVVTNPAQLTASTYTIAFPTATTYTVTPAPITGSAAGIYTPGQAIAFDGMQVAVNGQPTPGNDTFTVSPSKNQSVFATITNLINTLKTPASGANLTNGLANAIVNLDNALSSFSNTQASQGLRLNELTALQTSGDNMDVQLKQSLSLLRDTNYTSTISMLNMQQTVLQVAQKSFAQVANLSMFTYM